MMEEPNSYTGHCKSDTCKRQKSQHSLKCVVSRLLNHMESTENQWNSSHGFLVVKIMGWVAVG
ncbi:protein of unknown function [Cyanobium sp. NIES-981]|nr:protein of unknown function [Cyanobium sp. NIES-981]